MERGAMVYVSHDPMIRDCNLLKTMMGIAVLGGAIIVLLCIAILTVWWLRGAKILLLPGLRVVISMPVVLGILISLEVLFIFLTVIIWRRL
jgi:hypothetical protein